MIKRRNAVSQRDDIARSFSYETANAREGVVFFWSKIDPLGPYEVITGKLWESTVGVGMMAYNHRNNAPAKSYEQKGDSQSGVFKAWATDLMKGLGRAIGWNNPDLGWISWIAENLVRNLGPLLGSIKGGVQGLIQFGKALVAKVTAWWHGRKVELQSGHPQAMADGITKLINNTMLEGLYALVKSAVMGALVILTAGVSEIVGSITTVIEAVVRQIYATYHAISINDFIDICKKYMKLPQAARTAALSGAAADFNNTFREYTKKVPAIAAITLNSCLGGDKMRLLKMYGDDGVPINASSYQSGVKYLDTLSAAGREYSSFWIGIMKTDDKLAGLGLMLARDGVANKIVQRPWYKRLLGYNKYHQI